MAAAGKRRGAGIDTGDLLAPDASIHRELRLPSDLYWQRNKSMQPKRVRAAAWFVAVPLLAAMAGLVATEPPSPLAAAERLTQAAAFQTVGPQPPADADVVVIGITEETLAALPYRSPIDRGFLASLISVLAERGVRAIGLDIALDQPTEPAKDAALRTALLHVGAPVVVISVGPGTPMTQRQHQFMSRYLAGVRTGEGNLIRDRFDDTVRVHVPRDPLTGQLSFPAALAQAAGASVPEHAFPIEWRRATMGSYVGRDVPTYAAQLAGMLPPSWLKGKIALVGALIPGNDEHRTPATLFSKPSFGVDIHARVLSQIMSGRAVPAPRIDWLRSAATGALAIAGVALGTVWSGGASVAALVIFGVLFTAASLAAYALSGILVPLIAPVLALAISGAAARGWRGRADRRDRRALRALFSRFVSAPVVDEIMRERDLFMSGGRPRPQELTATVLYADVAAFTGICERLAPEPLIAWLDAYLEAMTSLIMAHHGVVLRFIGDGILAVFGAPVPRRSEAEIDRDAFNAASCAQAMEDAMAQLNDGWAAQGLPVGGLRIGLHTGPVVAGSLGRGARLEFCLLGDTANVGARLEQLGKSVAEPDPRYCTIVISEATRARLGEGFPALSIGEMSLRGRQAALAAYRIDAAAVRSRRQPSLSVSADP